MFDIDTNLTTTTNEEVNYSNPRPGSGPAPEGYSFFGAIASSMAGCHLVVWAEDVGYGTYIQVLRGKLPPSWDFNDLHAEECLDGYPWLSVGKYRLPLVPF